MAFFLQKRLNAENVGLDGTLKAIPISSSSSVVQLVLDVISQHKFHSVKSRFNQNCLKIECLAQVYANVSFIQPKIHSINIYSPAGCTVTRNVCTCLLIFDIHSLPLSRWDRKTIFLPWFIDVNITVTHLFNAVFITTFGVLKWLRGTFGSCLKCVVCFFLSFSWKQARA